MDAPEALREFLSYVVANLIDHPQQASIAVGTNVNGAVAFRVQLAQDDVRHVIGKNGMTVSAIRALLNTAAAKHGIKISLKVGSAREEDAEAAAADGKE
ncbi:MAG: KH domain-containing protein [Verrucomicrobiaceae bacterium]